MKLNEASERIGDLFWLIFKILVLGTVLIAVALNGFRYLKFILGGA